MAPSPVTVLDKVIQQDNTLYVLGIDEVLLKKLDLTGTRFRLASLGIPTWLNSIYQQYHNNRVLLLSSRPAASADDTMADLDEFDLLYDDIILTPTKAASLKKYWLNWANWTSQGDLTTSKPTSVVVVDHNLGNLLDITKTMTGLVAELKCYHITRQPVKKMVGISSDPSGSDCSDSTEVSGSSCVIL